MSSAKKATRLYANINRKTVLEVILNNAKVGITTVVRGHNGSGKTALKYDLQCRLPNHRVMVVDMSTKEPGDMLMPKFVVENGKDVVAGVPHKDLGLHEDGPVVVILDEIFKTKKSQQVALAQFLYEHKFGGIALHPDSIVVGFSNLEDEGFGDASLGFVYNRVQIVEMAKPTSDEWVDDFALKFGIHPTIIASAKEYPAMFADYRDYDKPGQNQYIFDPRMPMVGYVTGRSLERASSVLKANADMSREVLTHMLIQLLGERAAMDIMSVHALHEDLPSWESIMKNPAKAKVPTSAGSMCLLIYTAIQRLKKTELKNWMEYLKRMKKEAQALFASSVLHNDRTRDMAGEDKDFQKWVVDNSYLYKAVS